MILSLASILHTQWKDIFGRHCFALLFGALIINFYRNLWPLATYGGVPADEPEGIFMWIKLALLVMTAAIIPLFSPRKYVPVNPKVSLLFSASLQTD
jgi:hypothetical protein